MTQITPQELMYIYMSVFGEEQSSIKVLRRYDRYDGDRLFL
jgi:predicted transcriptional regulator